MHLLSQRRASPPMLASFSHVLLLLLLLMSSTIAASLDQSKSSSSSSGSGYSIERLDPRIDALLPADAAVETLATGRLWTEGPVFWNNSLLFSDVRDNAIYRWTDDDAKSSGKKEKNKGASDEEQPRGSLSELVRPSGWLSRDEPPTMWEPGSNGLALDAFGNLVAAQHGERQVVRVPLSELGGGGGEGWKDNNSVRFRVVASTFEGRRFNSPNDLAFNPSNGDLWFTDTVYGLEKYGDDPKRELPFQGVFRVPAAAYKVAVAGGEGEGGEKGKSATADSAVTLEISALSSPNGLAFSSDGRTLFVSNSGKEASFWASFEIDPVSGRVVKKKGTKKKENDTNGDGDNNNNNNGTCPDLSLSSSSLLPSLEEDGGTVLWDVTEELRRARAAGRTVGASDGFKLDARGNVFASAIDSVFVFAPRFEALLGRVVVGDKIGNVAFGGREGNELFIAANSQILRLKTSTKGSFYPAR